MTVDAALPGIDVLKRPKQDAYTLEYRVGLSHGFGGEREALQLGSVEAELLHVRRQSGLILDVTYHVSDRLSISGAWGAHTSQREDALRVAGTEAAQFDARERTTSALGIRYRLDPEHAYNPEVGVKADSDGGRQVDISISRISDPVITSLKVAYQVGEAISAGATSALSRDVRITGSVGLVAGDRVTLLASVGHRLPINRVGLPSSTATLTWSWEVDPVRRRSVGVWARLSHAQGRWEQAFGVGWSARLTWGSPEEKGAEAL